MIETYSAMTIKSMIKNSDNKRWHKDLQKQKHIEII